MTCVTMLNIISDARPKYANLIWYFLSCNQRPRRRCFGAFFRNLRIVLAADLLRRKILRCVDFRLALIREIFPLITLLGVMFFSIRILYDTCPLKPVTRFHISIG